MAQERFFGALFLGPVAGRVRRAECIGHDHRSGKEKRVAANTQCEYRAPSNGWAALAPAARAGSRNAIPRFYDSAARSTRFLPLPAGVTVRAT